MSVITHRNFVQSTNAAKPPATASDLTFAREMANRRFWQRARVLARRAYGPLIVYAILGVALGAVMALRVAAWMPLHWR